MSQLLVRALLQTAAGVLCSGLTTLIERRRRARRERDDSNNGEQKGTSKGLKSFIGIAGTAAGVALWMQYNNTTVAAEPVVDAEPVQEASINLDKFGAQQKGLPEYTLDDVSKHATLEDRIWVAYRHGVYDITDMVKEHPGGDKIMIGAGGSVEPFWDLYAVHKSPHVLDWFETFRIGNLSEDDVGAHMVDSSDPYGNEPRRHVALKPASKTPFNAEPPLNLLVDNLITPNELFYVRNHLPVPDIDPATFALEIEMEDSSEKTLSLDDIKSFPKQTITASIQCAGNRRSEMFKVKAGKGLSWGQAAIGNATWSGARLCDVMKHLGYDENNSKAQHVQFEGIDVDPTGTPYAVSIPIEKATDPRGDVLLAYEMNGLPIPRDHGYPLRVIVPGTVGARNVKWLGRIIISEHESDGHWQQNDYKGFAPNVDWDTVDFKKSPAIQELPVISAICDPLEGETIKVIDGKVTFKGYAWSGGGRKIVRVDVSVDGGKNWQAVETLESDSARHPRAWGWTLWKAQVPVPDGTSEVQLCVKAIDSQYNTQPENFENIWNLRGVLSNAYNRVNINVDL
ncbi:unnamed protein product, partial [Meganyctiphanes norvegica]